MAATPKIVWGTSHMREVPLESAKEYLAVAERLGIKEIDTARRYGDSEEKLGKLEAGKKFILQTKIPGRQPGTQTRQAVLEAQETSFGLLKVDKIDIYYLHAPDPETPYQETLDAIQELYTAGKFERFGLSNFSADQVDAIYTYNKERGYVLPTVYQGQYNPISRHTETTLFPTLRRLGISFYVYAAIAGGFLAKTVEQVQSGAATGRWDPNSRRSEKYNRPKLIEGLGVWHTIAKDANLPAAELAYRYVAYHSAIKADLGDAIIVGASRPEQLDQTIKGIRNGPLSQDIADRIEKVWDIVESEAPLANLTAWSN